MANTQKDTQAPADETQPTASAEGEQAVAVDAAAVEAAQDKSDKTDLRDGAPKPQFLTGRTSDSDDRNRSWTVQSDVSYADEASKPGQTFVREQLPRPEEQSAAGIDPVAFSAPLPVVDRAPEDKSLVPDDVFSGRV